VCDRDWSCKRSVETEKQKGMEGNLTRKASPVVRFLEKWHGFGATIETRAAKVPTNVDSNSFFVRKALRCLGTYGKSLPSKVNVANAAPNILALILCLLLEVSEWGDITQQHRI
jgi:hypothetical protein